MNQSRRNQINTCLAKLQALLEAEQEQFDSASARWQESEKGEECQVAIEQLETAIEALEAS